MELKFEIENFLTVNQVCPLRVQPWEKESIFFKRHVVFEKKIPHIHHEVKCAHLVPEPNNR